MSEESDHAQVYRLFAQAMEREGAARAAFVQEHCGQDADLRRQVENLIAVAQADGVTGMLLAGGQAPTRDLRGAEYGRFRLRELLGSGGMSVVYLAERTDGVPQTVAVKLLHGAIDPVHGARFVSEARFLARLKHPAIAQLIDVGVKDGAGWLAVELVRGRPIDEYCDEHHLDLRQRVKLLAMVAGAVATAHKSFVVHSDIKPTNVLVDDEGHPKLIDFGIASALSDGSGAREPTADLRRFFTPNYAAPEQVLGQPVTVATDVFGLGALGYRLLTGTALFPDCGTPLTYLHAVATQEVGLASRAARADPARERALRGDLDAILGKALERDPERRYASALDLQADLHRYLDGLPVAAHAPSLRYRLVKRVRRHALASALATVLVLGLAAGGVLYGLQARVAREARDAAARRGEFLERMLKSADPHTGRRDITVAELLDSAARQLDQDLGHEPLVEGSMLGLIADTNNSLARYPEALAASDRQLALLRANGASSLDIARALVTRGEVLVSLGRYADATPVLREARGRLRGLPGASADYALALNALGEATMNDGGEKEAEQLFREAIALDRDGTEAMHQDMADALQDLAVLYFNQDRFAESAETGLEAVQAYRRYRPPDYPDLLNAEAGYAETLMHLHRPAEAEPVFRDVLERGTRVRGAEHPDTLVTQSQLGESLMEQKRYPEAVKELRAAAEGLDRGLGESHRYPISAWSNYAIASCLGPDPAGGLAAEERIAALRAKTLPAGDWRLANTQAILGLCLGGLKRYAEAEAALRQGSAGLEASRGLPAANTQRAYQWLRDLYLKMGRAGDAAALAAKIAPERAGS
ncbi:MAG: serine/threonine protein kinase [Proteobacteria bacterium]|nr:serine/threonine protein kinase [Pseudomonadota bacterium]